MHFEFLAQGAGSAQYLREARDATGHPRFVDRGGKRIGRSRPVTLRHMASGIRVTGVASDGRPVADPRPISTGGADAGIRTGPQPL